MVIFPWQFGWVPNVPGAHSWHLTPEKSFLQAHCPVNCSHSVPEDPIGSQLQAAKGNICWKDYLHLLTKVWFCIIVISNQNQPSHSGCVPNESAAHWQEKELALMVSVTIGHSHLSFLTIMPVMKHSQAVPALFTTCPLMGHSHASPASLSTWPSM